MRVFDNLKILTKVSLVLVFLLIISVTVSVIGFRSVATQEKAAGWTDHTYKVIGALTSIMAAMVDQETGMRGYVIAGSENFLDPQKAGAAAYAENLAKLRSLTSDNANQQARITELDDLVKTWTATVVDAEKRLMQDPATVEQARQVEISGAGKQSMDGIRTKVKEMTDAELRLLNERSTIASDAAETARLSTIVGGAAMALVAIMSLVFLNFALVRPVRGINSAMANLAGGDTRSAIPYADRTEEVGQMAKAVEVFRQAAINNLRLEEEATANRAQAEADRVRLTQEAEAAAQARLNEATSGLATGLRRLAAGDLAFRLDEPFAPDFEALRHDLNAAVSQLGSTLSGVANASGLIDNGSREIASSADDLSKRTEQQAASLEETAAALDQITSNVASSSKRADEARTAAAEANTSAAQSGAVVAKAVDAMHRIEQSSNQISNIIGVIDEIAFQTNLLALNAGVEAARAGEAGKGFAVVAQEVRELAQRSAQAAKEIKDLIRNSSVEVEGGVKLVRETGEALRTIEQHVVVINQHMDAIATSSREQSVGLAEVNTAVNQMDQVTQQNAAMVEETNAASATLAEESARLRDLIAQFSLAGAQGRSANALRQMASTMARPTPSRAPQHRAIPATHGNAALKREDWSEF